MEEVKYLHDGRAVIVRGQMKKTAEYVVSEVLEGVNGDENYIYPSEVMFTVEKVFDEAPTAMLSKEVSRLNGDIQELVTIKNNLRADIAKIERDNTTRLARFKRYDALKHIEEFIAGKIAHYLIFQWGELRIVPFGEAVSDEDRWNKTQKLLTLAGKTNGDLEWRLHQYSDGSGTHYTVLPCLSLDEARAEAQKCIDKQEPKDVRESIVKFAAEYNLVLPDWYIPAIKDSKRKQTEGAIRDLEKRLEEARKNAE